MSIKILILLLLLFCCCGQEQNPNRKQVSSSKIQNQENKIDATKLLNKIDSIAVTGLFFGNDLKAFSLYFSKGNLWGRFYHSDNQKITVNSPNVKNKFTNYINQFYIEKNEPIILSKDLKPRLATDYPFIEVEGFKKGIKLFKQETTIYSNIKFNPNFIEFYNFLDSLVKDRGSITDSDIGCIK